MFLVEILLFVGDCMLYDYCFFGTVDTRGWFKNDSLGISEVKIFIKCLFG